MKRVPVREQDPKVRAKNFEEVCLGYNREEATAEASRCLQCKNPQCVKGCPVNIDIPGFIGKLVEGSVEDAYHVISKYSALPAVCGRVCPQESQCESKCIRGIKGDAVSIGKLERYVADTAREEGIKPAPAETKNGKKVAVIGSGPAGLAAANQLNRRGYAVTVFEKLEYVGGLLRFGIPNFKLSKSVIDRRVAVMEAEGITFKVNTDIDVTNLPEGFDAYCICTGTPQARDLNIPGRELKGIHFAMEMLAQQNRVLAGQRIPEEERITAKGKHVLVIGGGDTGSDCIGTSNRQGALSVTQIEIMPKPPVGHNPNTPWPQWPVVLKTSSSHEEGCIRRWSLTSNRFLEEDGKVCGVEVEEVEWTPGAEGERPVMKPTGKKEILKADLVLLAMGFLRPVQPEFPANVFVAGDAATGASLVVKCIAGGRKAAADIDAYLSRK